MRAERFTPNECVTTCWYVKYGDCYTDLYYDLNGSGTFAPPKDEHLVKNHGSHRLPAGDDDYFKTTGTDAVAEPSVLENYKYYTCSSGNVRPGFSYTTDNGFTQVYPYLFEYNGTKHYVKEISYAPSKGMS